MIAHTAWLVPKGGGSIAARNASSGAVDRF